MFTYVTFRRVETDTHTLRHAETDTHTLTRSQVRDVDIVRHVLHIKW